MPVLFFPNPDALRLAVASGVVPSAVADAPARAGFDEHGHLWLEPAELPPRDAAPALARLGVQILGDAGVPTDLVACWAELLPLRRSSRTTNPALVLFETAPDRLARFLADLRRLSRAPAGVKLLPSGEAWVTVPDPPAILLMRCEEPDSPVEPFTEHAPGVWVRAGWEHPLPDRLIVPPGHLWLLRPPRVLELCEGVVPTPAFDEVRLPHARGTALPTTGVAAVPVRFTLARSGTTPREVMWVFAGDLGDQFREFCRTADDRVLREYESADVTAGEGRRVIVRVAEGKRVPPQFPLVGPGFYPDPRSPGLFAPGGFVLRPVVRAKDVARVFGLGADRVVWLEPAPGGGFDTHTVPLAAFRPIGDLMDYSAPAGVPLDAEEIPADTFALALPTVIDDRPPPPDLEEPPSQPERLPEAVEIDGGPGWLARSVDTFARRVRWALQQAAGYFAHPPDPAPPRPTRGEASGEPPRGRVAQKLSSADALLHGHDRAARRHELESRLLDEFPRLGPEERAGRWAELAAVYGATGNPADAAVCWINAIWETDPPPEAWLEQWFLAECRSAKQTDPAASLDRWLSEPGKFGVGRVVAAYAAWAGHQPTPPTDLLISLPRVLAFLDQHFDDLPARAAWLSRLAVTKLCEGDALGLARWRDRVVHRIRDRGPGLDLDEPSFLRFHGTASAERFQTAREWLGRLKEPILDWVKRLGTPGKLQWAGLDAETECTAAYAQLMMAWGQGCLGERTRSRDWAARARKMLTRPAEGMADPNVHAVLADAFHSRIRDAQEGRSPPPGLSAELAARADALPTMSRYAVDKLREHCRILEPVERVRSFRGTDLREFRGRDLLGERLHVLANETDPAHLNDDAKLLLAACQLDPSSGTVPRVALTLLEVAPHLHESLIPKLLGNVVPAVEWMEAWVQTTRFTEPERARHLPRYQARLLDGAFAAAAWFDQWAASRPIVAHLLKRVADGGLRPALALAAGPLFRSLGKLGYRSEAVALLRALDAGRPSGPFPPQRLGLAVGWFAAGNEDAGNRVLDEARDRLFLSGPGDGTDRTELAIAYAEALGHAPPRIALGRLEEIFQRLDRIKVTGSTNLYFTLKPLQLIDAVVRSVVSDDFALGPAVRGWLDDDEFLIRRRIHRDMAAVLHADGLG